MQALRKSVQKTPANQPTNQPTIHGVDTTYHDFRDIPSLPVSHHPEERGFASLAPIICIYIYKAAIIMSWSLLEHLPYYCIYDVCTHTLTKTPHSIYITSARHASNIYIWAYKCTAFINGLALHMHTKENTLITKPPFGLHYRM